MPDMRLDEMEKKDFSTPSLGPKAPKYPMGLRITLGPAELKKLGMKVPEVDSKVKFEATAEVVEVSVDESEGDVNKHSVTLQIVDLYLEKDESATKALYGE